jgi:hypothetical protein
MISLKVLSTAAAMALVLPMVAPSASLAQAPPGLKAQGAPGGGGGVRAGGGIKAGGGGFVGGGGPRYGGGGGGGGGYYRGGGGGGYYRHGGGGGFIPGAVAGAVIGGAIASQSYGYYGGGPGYYAPGYYDQGYDQGYDDSGPVAVDAGPGGGDDSVAYCMQTYRSYNPRTGTYLGNDGYRHPCP